MFEVLRECRYLSSRITKITDHAPQINNGSHLTERGRYLPRQFVFVEVERDQIFQIPECIGYRSSKGIIEHAGKGNKRTISAIRTSIRLPMNATSLNSHLAPRNLVIPPIADGILPRNCIQKKDHAYPFVGIEFPTTTVWETRIPHTQQIALTLLSLT